ncbi:MAG TPA: hydrogenase expression/formation protein HypE [Pseudomonadota bacterium]|nr:hydrogenase expression/formation protein HypE [Pseudomonadota bacterium]
MFKHHLLPLDFQSGKVELPQGSGGRATAQLVEELFARHLRSPELSRGHDAAVLPPPKGRWAVSTDSFVVSPLFFPGGCIGDLAVFGSVNDVSMAGAVPLALTAGFILEEGFPLSQLKRIVIAMEKALASVGIPMVSADTKVVERGKADGLFINTTCFGVIPDSATTPSPIFIDPERASPSDAILLSGPIGEHGIAILSQREGISFETDVVSDTAPLHTLVQAMLSVEPDLHVLRDPTRGGVAAALHEIAHTAQVGIRLVEDHIPISHPVRSACELLGIDALHLACEGRLLAICSKETAPQVLAVMRAHPMGQQSALIGEVTLLSRETPYVELQTHLGGKRLVAWPAGEQLPRIC